ncbi:endonuclease domain-containing protein [Agromyces sp. SYSU K20354]|uniref:endonuclease domain-containing protein n=1 Tax=Agromyces cavernae TaxID=2898659 RepID=UPI001E3E8902|nr:DUF559 domain-containing protein [Agromyces cavernae]MCD2443771.1 endonuclease domain-containing protein [Agromyces cavernae]
MHAAIRNAFNGRSIARTSDLLGAGVGQHDIRIASRGAAIVRVRQGVWALPGAPSPVVVAAAHGGMPACVSAARMLGLWVLDESDAVHVAVGAKDRVHVHPGCRCRTHRVARCELGRRTGIVTMLVQVYRCGGAESFFVTLESALRQRRLTPIMLERLSARLPASARWMLGFAREDADSGLESLLRFRLREHGIDLVSQVVIGGVGRVDFVLGDRLILEVDGKPNHDAPPKRHRDLVRDAIAAGLGYSTLRFDYALIVHDWPTVLAAVLTTIDRGVHLNR